MIATVLVLLTKSICWCLKSGRKAFLGHFFWRFHSTYGILVHQLYQDFVLLHKGSVILSHVLPFNIENVVISDWLRTSVMPNGSFKFSGYCFRDITIVSAENSQCVRRDRRLLQYDATDRIIFLGLAWLPNSLSNLTATNNRKLAVSSSYRLNEHTTFSCHLCHNSRMHVYNPKRNKGHHTWINTQLPVWKAQTLSLRKLKPCFEENYGAKLAYCVNLWLNFPTSSLLVGVQKKSYMKAFLPVLVPGALFYERAGVSSTLFFYRKWASTFSLRHYRHIFMANRCKWCLIPWKLVFSSPQIASRNFIDHATSRDQ